MASPQPKSPTFKWPIPPPSDQDISIKEILERYTNADLLKHVLMAKSEEDKRQTAQYVLKTEQAKIQLRQLDLELVKIQQQQQQSAYPYLAPIQQQVLARITSPEDYPHSAHPLCRPYLHQPTTPVSPIEKTSKKRQRSPLSDDISRRIVMEALKAKLHRPQENKRQRTLPKLITTTTATTTTTTINNSPPPILPPIDIHRQPTVNRGH